MEGGITPSSVHSSAPPPPCKPYTNSVAYGMFAQWQRSPKGNHLMLGPYPPAPPSADLLSRSPMALPSVQYWQLGLRQGYLPLTIPLDVELPFWSTVLSSSSGFSQAQSPWNRPLVMIHRVACAYLEIDPLWITGMLGTVLWSWPNVLALQFCKAEMTIRESIYFIGCCED